MNPTAYNYQDIPGVQVIDSGMPGPNTGVSCLTHGNEPHGLIILERLRTTQPKKGKLFLICVNLEAYKKNKRHLEHDMNRFSHPDRVPPGVEGDRYKQLLPVIRELDALLDIHTLYTGEEIIALFDTNDAAIGDNLLNVDVAIAADIHGSGSFISEVTRQGGLGIGLECGHHAYEPGIAIGHELVMSYLSHFKLVDPSPTMPYRKNFRLTMAEAIIAEPGFTYIADFPNFTPFAPGEVYATSDNAIHKNTSNTTQYIGIHGRPKVVGKDCGFIFTDR